jgi:signal peptidase I
MSIEPASVEPTLVESTPVEPTPKPSNLLREIIETALLTAIIFLIVNAAIGRFRIESVSMLPNLHEGEYVIVDKVSYLLHPPERGDIIVFTRPNQPDLIKRVIGLPGDLIEIRGGRVHINGVALDEPYLAEPINQSMAAQQVAPDHYFVMGDNRNNSSDSRLFGAIVPSQIVGRAWIIYWPPPNWQIVPRYTYAAAASK